jgi:hypothetical protein
MILVLHKSTWISSCLRGLIQRLAIAWALVNQEVLDLQHESFEVAVNETVIT